MMLVLLHGISLRSCAGIMWQGFVSGETAGVTSVKRHQKLPHVGRSPFQPGPAARQN